MSPRLAKYSVALLACAVFAASCGIPVDDEPTALAIPDDRNPESTTTTTEPPRPGRAQNKLIYFISEGLLQPVERELSEPVTNQVVLDALIAGPAEAELELSIGTGLPDTFEARAVLNGEVLTVDILNEGGLQIEGVLRILVFAQIVFTANISIGATGGVLFRQEGEFVQALNGAGELQALGPDGIPEPLGISDFPDLRISVRPVLPSGT